MWKSYFLSDCNFLEDKDQIVTSACPQESEIHLSDISFLRWWRGDPEIHHCKSTVEGSWPIFLIPEEITTIAYALLTVGQTLS